MSEHRGVDEFDQKLSVDLSYDARAVRLDGLTYGWSLPFRRDCNGYIRIITGRTVGMFTDHKCYTTSCIYVRNKQDFDNDLKVWREEHPNYCGDRGLGFTCFLQPGLIFDTYIYKKGSMTDDGFANYLMK